MTDIQISDVCLLFALRREAAPFREEFRPQLAFRGAPCLAQFCGPSWLTVLCMESGVGSARVSKALEWALSTPRLGDVPYLPKLVVSAGFAGALTDSSGVGDVILATELADGHGNIWKPTWPPRFPGDDWKPRLHPGRILTLDRVVGEPDEKRALGNQHESLAVDMESAAVAQLCQSRQIPFACVRVISDDVRTRLSPALTRLLASPDASAWKIALAACVSPSLAMECWQLAKSTRHAARQLARALGELLTLTLPFEVD